MRLSEVNRLRLLYFLVLSCTAAWLPIFADDLQHRGFSGVQTAAILSITPVSMFLVQPLCGMLADRFGLRRYMIISSLGSGIAFLCLIPENSFMIILLLTALMSIFYNGLQPVLDSLTLQLGHRNGHESYGSIRMAGAIGWAVTGAVVGYFIHQNGTGVIYIFSSFALFLCFLLAFSLPDDSHYKVEKSETISLQRVIKQRPLMYMLMVVFIISATATTIWNFYSLYMKEHGASAELVGYGLSMQGMCEIPLFYFSAAIIQRFTLRKTFIVTAFATAIRMLLYSVVADPRWALLIELLHGISWSLFWVCCVQFTDLLVPSQLRATGQSLLYSAYFGIGAIVGNFWTGYLYDMRYSLSKIFLINSVIVFIAVACIFTLIKPLKEQRSESLS
jgi:PPP family 3-phenylpropionic acid transporter